MKNYIDSICDADIDGQNILAQALVNNLIDSEFDLLTNFQAHTDELKEFIHLKIQLCKIQLNKINHSIDRPVLIQEYQNKIDQLLASVKHLEHQIELKILQSMSELF